jgi:hypothetical protein
MQFRSWSIGMLGSIAAIAVSCIRYIVTWIVEAFPPGGVVHRAAGEPDLPLPGVRLRAFVERALGHPRYSAGRYDPGRCYG